MAQKLADIFKALSDPTRVSIVRKLLSEKEVSCQMLRTQFSLSQPALSHHFNKLIDANIITVRKNGTSHFYSINKIYLKNLGIDIQKTIERGGE
ncbi:helix-turn-helix transcriptional regulator [Candidatus Roizmanbacteria bacterium]|nr:helix-turn-helix transcriptional regulator [Candidatus Roizmanbacteria bacterium]